MGIKSNCKAYAEIKYVRLSPFKARRVADLVRGTEVKDALNVLKNLPHKGARVLYKAIHSAKANAENNHNISDDLFITELQINEAPRIKRYQPRARGRMFQIIKRNSHIVVGLDTRGDK